MSAPGSNNTPVLPSLPRLPVIPTGKYPALVLMVVCIFTNSAKYIYSTLFLWDFSAVFQHNFFTFLPESLPVASRSYIGTNSFHALPAGADAAPLGVPVYESFNRTPCLPQSQNGGRPAPQNRVRALPQRRGRRAGVSNYTPEESNKLLDFIEEVLPLGKNHWVDVTSRYATWAEETGRCARDHDALMDKYRKLSYTKKPTGDPSCPSDVRRAKRIARQILSKAQAVSLGASDSDSDADKSDDEGIATNCSPAPVPVGTRSRDKRPGAKGIRKSRHTPTKKDNTAALVAAAEVMAEKFSDMADSMASDVPGVEELVDKRIKDALAPTNAALAKLFSLVESRLPAKQ